MTGSESQGASRPEFWTRPPPRAVVFWACVVLSVLLTTAFWPTVVVLAIGGVFACCRLAQQKRALSRPAPRRRVQRRR
ncbi:hypothetical protein [Pirellulimonas nuda]|uniref:hypothetical protein n=1 Tax=Pirellulimonas nuda TaxID=2528009 RepID=UPI0011A3DBB6|nr:hypothetical protein [Pirellulimonas nuda]